MKKITVILALVLLFLMGLWLRLYSLKPIEKNERSIQVHIEGEVLEPGLYSVDEKTRLGELIKLAGGLSDKAGEVNLAQKLVDGEKILIPRIWIEGDEDSMGEVRESKIHSMSREQWMEISGIGEVSAGLILEYLKNNPQATIDELINVKGIGAKKLEVIRDHLGN